MSRFRILCTAAIVLVCADAATGQTPSRVIRLIDQRCAGCHMSAGAARTPLVEGAPELATLRRMTAETIFQAMTRGSMRPHVQDVPDDVKRAMAEFVRGPIRDLAAGASWNGWGPDTTSAPFQRAGGLSSDLLPRLRLTWAFGFRSSTKSHQRLGYWTRIASEARTDSHSQKPALAG